MALNNYELKKEIYDAIDKMNHDSLISLLKYIENNKLVEDNTICSYNYYLLTEGIVYNRGIKEEYVKNNYKIVAHFLIDMYCDLMKDSNKLSVVARKLFDNINLNVSKKTYMNIDRDNRFKCELVINPVIAVEDKDAIEKMIMFNEPIDKVTNYILNSKTAFYACIDSINFNFIYDEVQSIHPTGIFNYELMCCELKKHGFDLVLKDYISNKHVCNSYMTLLSSSLDKSANVYGNLRPVIFESNNEDYTIFNKNKVLKLSKND